MSAKEPPLTDEPRASDETEAVPRLLPGQGPLPTSRASLFVRYGSLALVAGLLALLAWAVLAAGRGSTLVSKIAAGKRPQGPGFDLGVLWRRTETWPQAAVPRLADGKLDLSELRGHPVVLNFWASWCIPCRDEAPILHAGALRHRGKVAFVGVDVQDFSSDALAFARKYRMNYVSVRDRGDKTYRAYGLTGVPETYYIDTRGRIIAHSPGAVSAPTLEQGIASIMGRPGRSGQLRGGAHIKR